MKASLIVFILCACVAFAAEADELYKVTLHSDRDATTLRSINTDIVLSVRDGYLVLTDDILSETLRQSGLDIQLLASDVRREQLAIDGRLDGKNAERFEVLYEDGQLRVLLTRPDRITLDGEPVQAFPLPKMEINVVYREPSARPLPEFTSAALDDIQDLIDIVEQDSVESYVLRLEAFYRRVPGTDSSYAARDYIAAKFAEFGYDSVVIDPFDAKALPSLNPCVAHNVIAYKVGTVYPDQHIVIGGHYDAVPDCPGADDNASGTAAVMECARVLAEVDTRMTIVFVAFDAEESGLLGAYEYVGDAVENEEDIVLMVNADMIADEDNSNLARLFTGAETTYALLWDQLANTYVGIDAVPPSQSSGSDHLPFEQRGFDVVFVHEYYFCSYYHTERDSSVHLNFDYMTRMVQASLATVYSVDMYPPPAKITSILQPGDGQSLQINWPELNPVAIEYFRLSYYPVAEPADLTTIEVPGTQSSYIVEGLTEDTRYAFSIQAFDYLGRTSLVYDRAYGTPSSIPFGPWNVVARPLKNAVKIDWVYTNTELDFSHCSIVRDGEIIAETLDTFYVDDDPALGSDMHYYYVVASDNDGSTSDTIGVEPLWTKAANLQPDRILAVNRTHSYPIDFVDEIETGAFMREALEGYEFLYFSDTAAVTCGGVCAGLGLLDMIDYGLVVIGAETGKWEDLAVNPSLNGIADTLAYYLSIGGKAVIFGRWGNLGEFVVLDYDTSPVPYDDAYYDFFHIDLRVQTPTLWDNVSTFIPGDLIGARSVVASYPDLFWDSIATVAHANAQAAPVTDVSGIPCATYVQLSAQDAEVIYTYDSRDDTEPQEGQPVAWRYFGPDYSYVFFDIPLSLFERDAAVGALRCAVEEVMAASELLHDQVPESFMLSQNYPNPFNPLTRIDYFLSQTAHVRIDIYNIIGQKVTTLVNEVKPAGNHTAVWYGLNDAGKPVATGLYLYRMSAGGHAESKKMLLIK